MSRIFVLRAFGDFAILLQCVLRSENKGDYKLVVSDHLKPLYEAIVNRINVGGLQIEFKNFGVKKSQINLFTNKHLIHKDTLLEVSKIKSYLKSSPSSEKNDYLEQNKRKHIMQLLTGHGFKSIFNGKKVSIYDCYSNFFKSNYCQDAIQLGEIKNVLIFPDSRLVKKNIPNELLTKLTQQLGQMGYNCDVAIFKQISSQGQKSYENFDELLNLIIQADYIIGADSLPIHLAQLFNKPHYIFYAPFLTKKFITPYSKGTNSFGDFDNYSISIIQE